jgi:heat shock protein HslJ
MRLFASLVLVLALSFSASARADENGLAGKWRVERIAGLGAFDTQKTSLELRPDGRAATSVGCNRMIGKAEIHGKTIIFGPMAMTRMACPPPLDDIETKYAAALEAARTFRRDGGALTFANDKGDVVLGFRSID